MTISRNDELENMITNMSSRFSLKYLCCGQIKVRDIKVATDCQNVLLEFLPWSDNSSLVEIIGSAAISVLQL